MWIHVYSGLTSRCITLAHAYHLMKDGRGGKKLTIVWPIDSDCGIGFWEVFADDLFADINLKVIEILQKNYYKTPEDKSVVQNIRNKQYRKALVAGHRMGLTILQKQKVQLLHIGKVYIDYTPSKNTGWSGEKHRQHLENTWKELQSALSKENREVYVYAYCGIIKDNEESKVDYSIIKFRKIYWEKVYRILSGDFNYVGVHIRRTDHEVTIQESTTDMFIGKMNAILESQPDIKFFLATDDIKEEENLKRIYGDKIIVQEYKSWGRDNADEMQSGIIDCLCLSCCDYILGSFTSVFSSFAAQYGKKQLIICKKSDDV